MRAVVGDRLHFLGKSVGVREHGAVITEIRVEDGGPPYVVRNDDGHESVVYPGTDCWVDHRDQESADR
jgi:hypothetical protein